MSRYGRRKLVNRTMEVLATLAALLAVGVLVLVVASVALRAAGALSWDFFTQPQALFGQPGGGIANAIVGTLLLVVMATAMAVPVGVLSAIYLTEFAPRRFAMAVQVVIDVLAGLPTIVIGIFVYALLVIGHTQSGVAGAVSARDHHAATHRALDAGGTAPRAVVAARGESRARSATLAHGSRRDPAL